MTPGDTTTDGAWIGQTIDGRYQIRELLGEGGMGAVYAAEHLSLRKQVALKVIHPEFAGNAEIAARFTREAMATAQLDHPNVASALDYGTLPGGGAYLVTQLVRGRSLESHRAAGRMQWRQVCDLGSQIADALTAAHAIHIVHRDLKPDNILLEPRDDGTFLVKVLDFGVARITAGANLPTSDLTRMGTVIGTPGYMAPEQAMGESVDFRVDIYALGVIMWECIAGKVLWDGASVSELFTTQLAGPAPPLANEVPGLPPELSALVDLMLDRNPRRRPESARQIRDALRRMAHSTLIASPAHKPAAAAAAVANPFPRWVLPVSIAVLVALVVIGLTMGQGKTAQRPSHTTDTSTVTAPAAAAGRVEAAPADSDVPAELAGPLRALLGPGDAKARKAAADAILDHEPREGVALYARNVAWLERANTCEARKAVVKKIAEDGDARALPALQLLSKSSRKGCGLFKNTDCNECLRDPLRRTIDQLSRSGAD
ncbi:MAG TPA: serine/threonine-protein kinase [Nannocystis sp.]